jgi:pimeloyl-ACP methyl ester carboxylesterase
MDLHYVRTGKGQPLLLLHPLGGSHIVWEPVLEGLALERDVIAPDMPGFGESPPVLGSREPTPQALAGVVAAFLDDLGIDRAHVAGNSLGGWVALELAKLGRALSVTALSPAGFSESPLGPRRGIQARTVARALRPLVPLLVRTVRGRRLVLGRAVGHPDRMPAEDAVRIVRDYVTSPKYQGASTAMRSGLFSGIEEISVPVTLAWADLDPLVTEPRTRIPGVRWVVLHGCGHIPTWDDPPQVARIILEGSAGE